MLTHMSTVSMLLPTYSQDSAAEENSAGNLMKLRESASVSCDAYDGVRV